MPMQSQIHPYYLRERGAMETDEQYTRRMAELDARDELIRSTASPAPDKENL